MLFMADVFPQAPDKMSYQAVIRNSSDMLVANTPIGMRIHVIQGSPFGAAVYVETHTPISNINGLVSLEIGSGTAIVGSFSSIDWSDGPYFLKTESDPSGGTNYTISGTSELLSVPYALYAKDCEASSLIKTTVIDASCPPSISLTTTYAKIGDIGNFTKTELGSIMEITFQGRIRIATVTSAGAIFELRVDDIASSVGRARAVVKSGEAGSDGVMSTLTGLFPGLSVGTHTVSLWARTSSGTATGAMWDPGCWSADVVIAKEIK